MVADDLIRARLARQWLGSPGGRIWPKSPETVVTWFGAVQAQDYAGARWALGQRLAAATDASIEEACDRGRIIRTHVMRPTWHFVAPQDLRWLLALTAPRVHAASASVHRQYELDARTHARCRTVLERALTGHRHLTRDELAVALERARIPARGVRLAYVLMHAELEALICSGPRRGKQFTYALVDERVAPAPARDRDESLAMLVERYFTSHGPATARDFAWWSGLTVRDATRGLEALGQRIDRHVVDGRTYHAVPVRTAAPPDAPTAWLLPNYDEFLIAYKDRELSVPIRRGRYAPSRVPEPYPHQLVIDGRLAGAWQRRVGQTAATVTVRPFTRLSRAHAVAVRATADRYGTFLGMSVTLATASR